jgi:hypothetical protein
MTSTVETQMTAKAIVAASTGTKLHAASAPRTIRLGTQKKKASPALR